MYVEVPLMTLSSVLLGLSVSNLGGPAGTTVTDKSPARWAWAQHAGSPLQPRNDVVNGTSRKRLLCFYTPYTAGRYGALTSWMPGAFIRIYNTDFQSCKARVHSETRIDKGLIKRSRITNIQQLFSFVCFQTLAYTFWFLSWHLCFAFLSWIFSPFLIYHWSTLSLCHSKLFQMISR